MKKLILVIAVIVVVAFTPRAMADEIDLSCSGTKGADACHGKVKKTGSNYSSSAVSVNLSRFDADPGELSDRFRLSFNTATSMAKLVDTTDGDVTLQGTIVSFTATADPALSNTTDLNLIVDWTGIDIDGHINISGSGSSDLLFKINNGIVVGADASIVMAEASTSTLLLLGTGLLGLAIMLRRQIIT